MNVILDKMIALFNEHREEFGCSDEEDLESQCKFEDAFAEIVCEWKGHNLINDMCMKPEHDFCTMCGHRREKLFPKDDEELT